MALLIGIQKRIAYKRGAHQVRRPCWYHNGARLPGKTVSPAPVRNASGPKGNQSLDHQLDKVSRAQHPDPRKPEECREKQRDGFGVLSFWDKQEWANVKRAPLQNLSENQPRKSPIEER